VPLTERLEEFLRNRDIQVDLNAIQQQLQDQILAGLSAGIGYSLSTIQIFLLTVTLMIAVVAFFFHTARRGTSLSFILKIVPNTDEAFAAIVKRKFLALLEDR